MQLTTFGCAVRDRLKLRPVLSGGNRDRGSRRVDAAAVEPFVGAGYETLGDFLDADDTDRVEMIESLTNKNPQLKKLHRAASTAKGTRLYIAGRTSLHAGRYARASQCFSLLLELTDTEHITDKVDRAREYLQIATIVDLGPSELSARQRAHRANWILCGLKSRCGTQRATKALT